MNDLFSTLNDAEAPSVNDDETVSAGLPSPAEAVSSPDGALPGYRLQRLEVFNWGTFDGVVHSLVLDGQTTLLVGQNGAGKSTLVDVLLTLLVRPGKTRNYNLAAGANKTERSEKSYILGAYDRRSQEDSNRGDIRYLRSNGTGTTTYSVLLACFQNRSTDRGLTLAQVLFLNDGEVHRVFCFARDERSIARDCSGLKGMDKLRQEMERRGWRATTKYNEYFDWFRKATGVKEQAMDMFNQTVAVKDIQRLNDFIRKHMLEAKPWSEKVDELFQHFKDLSDAHRELERVRQQRTLLEPIETHGTAFRQQAEQLKHAERLLAAADSYFPQKIIDLFEPEIALRQDELKQVRAEQQRLKTTIDDAQDERQRIRSEIDQAGGERMRQIPLLIRNHETEAAAKRANFTRLSQALHDAEIDAPVSDAAEFDLLRSRLAPLREQLQADAATCEQQRATLIESRVDPVRSLRDAEAELQVLTQRPGNLPPEHVELRRRMCDELGMTERDLPFAAELIAVKPDQRDWEGSIEMVLRSFALSLLVPQRHYHLVSRYIDRTLLRDSRGRGQKLVYLQVGERERQAEGPKPEARSLFWKLEFRDGWSPLLPWVKAELHERYNFRCCETLEEFQQSHERALTRQRHLKLNSTRHEKDDRDRVADPRHFVLGWDNRDKKQRLAEAIESLKRDVERIDLQVKELSGQTEQIRRRIVAVEMAERFKTFAEMDVTSHEHEISELRLELKALEENNDTIRMLKDRIAKVEQHIEALQVSRDHAVRREQALDSQITGGQRIVQTHRQTLARHEAEGSFPSHAEFFAELDSRFSNEPLTLDNVSARPDAFRRVQTCEVQRLRDELKPLEDSVVKAMGKFLNVNPEERLDLEVSLQFLPDFLRLLERIRAEDLPRFEQRFKERLNEKVGQEIGVLRGNLSTEKTHIEDRIQILNQSLRQVPFGNGSHMRLVAREVRDPEIKKFQQDLDACVSGQFEGTLEADEARFQQIEALINKLRDEERWRLLVTDVRNWFDFAAVETDDLTGAERSYHDDSAGQSGGEKAKLAFTILIAAIAFQYDLDPQRPARDRFHFVVVDEMFSRVDDENSVRALELFKAFGLQLLIVAPLDAKARVTEDFVGCYLHVSKDDKTNRSQVLRMTAREFAEQVPPGDTRPNKPR
jgi:uncharacterized protein YPO0396